MMLVCGQGISVMRVHGSGRTGLNDGVPAPVVIRAAERHGRCGGPLHRERQHQQPDQDGSDEQTHVQTLPQAFLRPVQLAEGPHC